MFMKLRSTIIIAKIFQRRSPSGSLLEFRRILTFNFMSASIVNILHDEGAKVLSQRALAGILVRDTLVTAVIILMGMLVICRLIRILEFFIRSIIRPRIISDIKRSLKLNA